MRYAGFVPILIACAFLPFARGPDVIAAETGRLFAVRDDAKALWFSNVQVDKFAREEWMERDGTFKAEQWAETGRSAGGRLVCEPSHCLYDGGRVVFIADATEGALQACQGAQLVFSQGELGRKACGPDTIVRDVKSLRYFGAHAAYLEEKGLTLETVREARGVRPWTGRR